MNKLSHNNYKSINLYGQLELPVDTSYLPVTLKNDEFFLNYLEILEQTDLRSCFKKPVASNAKHDPVGILAAIILAEVLFPGTISTRQLEDWCSHDIRFICLTDEKQPKHMVFQRCLNNLDLDKIHQLAQQITELIGKKMGFSKEALMDTQYIDGTKIEGNANKNSFVYKNRLLTSIKKKTPKITEKINEINENEALGLPFKLEVKEQYCAQDLFYDCWLLGNEMKERGIEFKYGRGKRKSELQRALDIMSEFYLFILDKECWLGTIGENRGSCSKTDNDATFMPTKRDYYNKTGLRRACYNLQIAVSLGLITESQVFQEAADVNTYPVFMETFREDWGDYPKRTVGDAGYGYLNNYRYNKEHGIESYLKTIFYDQKKTAKFRKKIKYRENWTKDEFGNYVCADGRVFTEVVEGSDGVVVNKGVPCWQITMKEPRHCEGCPLREECKPGKNGRSITIKPEYEEFKEAVESLLNTPEGQEEMNYRRIYAEGAFGIIKNNHHVTRFRLRGMGKVSLEVKLLVMGFNLRKLKNFLEKNKEKEDIPTIIDAVPAYEQDLLSL